MIPKAALAMGIGAVVVLGATGTALALESDPTTGAPTSTPTSVATPAPTSAPSPSSAGHRRQPANVAFPGEYAQWTTFDAKTNMSTVHDGIRGQVNAVSPTSITVKAANGTAETFAVDANTTVRARGDTRTNKGTISQVEIGDQVVVVGTGQGTFTATHVDDRGTPSQPRNGRHR